MPREGEGAVVRQGRLIGVVVAFLINCAVLLVAGASEVQAEASKKVARCEGTRTITPKYDVPLVSNDVPGCPKGGLLLGTDKKDKLGGQEGDDKIRGLGGPDYITGGSGDDVIYGGPGDDTVLEVENGEDVIYGGDGNDHLAIDDGHRDKLYCGEGNDHYQADPNDYVDSSCEPASASVEPSGSVSASGCNPNIAPGCGGDFGSALSSATSSASPGPVPLGGTGGPAILLPAAALLLGSGILTYAILRRR
jgi:Ca2+-binding RTX toxin-like protein